MADKPLDNWQALNAHVQTMDEQELQKLLKKEQMNKNRMQFLIRIYGRYNKLRTIRERKELIGQ